MELAIIYKGNVKNDEQARSFWYSHNRRQRKIEKSFIPKISRALKAQINAFVDALDSHGYEYAKLMIDSIVTHEGIAGVIKQLLHKGAYIESNVVLNYLRQPKKSLQVKRSTQTGPLHSGPVFGIGFDELSSIIDQYFEVFMLRHSAIPITEFTKKLITKHLIERIDAGENIQDAISNFKALAISWTGRGGKADTRARLIAATETTRTISFGGLIGGYMSGVDIEKVWVTSDDERVRGASSPAPYPHTELDLKVAALNGSFYNGEEIRFPGDPQASIENTAQCRCANYFREKTKPKPVATRTLIGFINDIMTGFLLGGLITEIVQNEIDNV